MKRSMSTWRLYVSMHHFTANHCQSSQSLSSETEDVAAAARERHQLWWVFFTASDSAFTQDAFEQMKCKHPAACLPSPRANENTISSGGKPHWFLLASHLCCVAHKRVLFSGAHARWLKSSCGFCKFYMMEKPWGSLSSSSHVGATVTHYCLSIVRVLAEQMWKWLLSPVVLFFSIVQFANVSDFNLAILLNPSFKTCHTWDAWGHF